MNLGLYQHYNGNFYQVIGVCRHTETLEEMVVYKSLYGDYGLWVRPKAMFESKLEKEGKLINRFTYIRSMNTEAPAYT